MQTQAPGYKPTKKTSGVRKGVRGNVNTGGQPSKAAKKKVRKTSPYSKNRTGVKTTEVGKGYKSMALDNQYKHQQVASNNLPGFQAPIGPPSVMI